MTSRDALLASAAVAAFAGNSLIARAALGPGLIEPGAFSAIRLLAGALVLLPLIGRRPKASDLPGGLALLVYMVGFSIAYRDIPTATGALILFASVQTTVVLGGMAQRQPITMRAAVGLLLAIAGTLWLLLPSAVAPAPLPATTMVAAGIAWGVYTLIGRDTFDPVGQTARNLAIAAPLALPAMALDSSLPSLAGALLAVLAGVATSAFGYVVWYKVAPRLGLASVAAVQLATPIAAGSAAALLLAEPVTTRLAVAGAIVLGGIALTLKR